MCTCTFLGCRIEVFQWYVSLLAERNRDKCHDQGDKRLFVSPKYHGARIICHGQKIHADSFSFEFMGQILDRLAPFFSWQELEPGAAMNEADLEMILFGPVVSKPDITLTEAHLQDDEDFVGNSSEQSKLLSMNSCARCNLKSGI